MIISILLALLIAYVTSYLLIRNRNWIATETGTQWFYDFGHAWMVMDGKVQRSMILRLHTQEQPSDLYKFLAYLYWPAAQIEDALRPDPDPVPDMWDVVIPPINP